MIRKEWFRGMTTEDLETIVKALKEDTVQIAAEVGKRRTEMNCYCKWKNVGLGAEVSAPDPKCDVHGTNGPMTMFAQCDKVPDNANSSRNLKTRTFEEEADRAKNLRESVGLSDVKLGVASDQHQFSSGAKSSGKKPPYTTIPLFALQRFAEQRRVGDERYGVDNWLKGTDDKAFILDRINHGIEHLLILAAQVKMGYPGNQHPGEDDAAAVMCNAMFVMGWQKSRRESQEEDANNDTKLSNLGKQATESTKGWAERGGND